MNRRENPHLGNTSLVVVRSSANRSPLERERSVQDCWRMSEEMNITTATIYHGETQLCFGCQRRWRYSRPTFGSNTTNSAGSRTLKCQAALEIQTTLPLSRY